MVVILSSTFENPLLRWTEHELDIPDVFDQEDGFDLEDAFVRIVEHHDEGCAGVSLSWRIGRYVMKLQSYTDLFKERNVVYDEGVLDPRARSIIDSSLPVPTDDHVLSYIIQDAPAALVEIGCRIMYDDEEGDDRARLEKAIASLEYWKLRALEAEEQSKSKASTSKVSTSKVSTSKAEELCKGRASTSKASPSKPPPTDSLKRPRPTHQPKNVEKGDYCRLRDAGLQRITDIKKKIEDEELDITDKNDVQKCIDDYPDLVSIVSKRGKANEPKFSDVIDMPTTTDAPNLMKYYEEVWSFKYQCVRPSKAVKDSTTTFLGFQEVAFEAQRVIVRMLSKKANVLIAKEDSSEGDFPEKLIQVKWKNTAWETYGSIEGRKAMNKTLASKAILPLTEVPESLAPIIPTCTDYEQKEQKEKRPRKV
jgi:hypothetical protein